MKPKQPEVLIATEQRVRLEQRAAAAADILVAEPMEVGELSVLRAELDELRGGGRSSSPRAC
ncbi:hypothetical protein LG314_12530 [Agrococcus terreus]|uniref:hypothetical protein n=1 Tax=Agrococcus terreus TaxID=574649 RepID=UPI00384BD70F